MTCPCGNPASGRCAWKLRRPFMIWGKDLRLGDSIEIEGLYWIVQWIGPVISTGQRLFATALGDRYIPGDNPVMVKRIGRCEAPICEQCSREVAEETRYCRAHWSAHEMPERDLVDQREEVEHE